MFAKLRSHVRHNVVGYIALFVALGGTGAYAANTINSSDIVNGEVKTPDLANNAVTTPKLSPNSVGSGRVVDSSLRAIDLAEGAIVPGKFGTIPAALVRKGSDQAIPNTGIMPLTFDTEDFDTAGLHDSTTNNSRLTAPIAGIYQVSAGVFWNDLAENGVRAISLVQDGGPCATAGCKAESVHLDAGSDFETVQSVSALLRLDATNFVEAQVAQGSAGSLSVEGAPRHSTFLAMTWVGPG